MKLNTLRKVLEADEDGTLVLPDFQREFVWKREQQKKLISTILVKIPINSMLILEGKSGSFAEKKMCIRDSAELCQDGLSKSYLLDGQQRLSTLKCAFSDLFHKCEDWKKRLDILEYNLNFRWFINVEADDRDVFGLKYLSFPDSGDCAVGNLEPSDVEPYIEAIPVYKKSEKEWISPSFDRFEFIRECSDRHFIPLYMLYYDERCVSRILTKIQNDRINRLRIFWDTLSVDEKRRLGENAGTSIEKWLECSPSDKDNDWNEFWNNLGNTWASNFLTYLKGVLDREITFITLNEREISRAIVIFENLNNSGTALSTFDLLVARAAKHSSESLVVKLYSYLNNNVGAGRAGEYDLQAIGILDKDNKMTSVFKNAYFNLLSLIINMDKMPMINLSRLKDVSGEALSYMKRNKILQLDGKAIHDRSLEVVIALLRTLTFLNLRCGICKISDINYKGMLLPIAYLLRDDSIWTDEVKKSKIEYWYWVSLLGGRYINNQNEVTSEDVVKLYDFVENFTKNHFADYEKKVLNFNKYSDRETLLNPDEAPTAIKNGIVSFVLSRKPHDFISSSRFTLDSRDIANKIEYPASLDSRQSMIKLELHHIIPLGINKMRTMKESTSKLRKEKKHILNSPLNLTYISDIANGNISVQAPDHYLQQLYSGSLEDHFIPDIPNNSSSKVEQEKFLRGRYNLLKRAVDEHINSLKIFWS